MKQGILFFGLMMFWVSEVFPQSDFREGYLVTYSGDTIFGLIDYRGDKANSKYCLFKNKTGENEIRKSPAEISAYRFTDSKYYVSKAVNTGEKADTLFLEFLINGIVDIYYYRDNLDENYMVDGGDGKLLLLSNEQKEVMVDNKKYVRNAREYVGVLKYVFMKSPSVCKEVEDTSLGHKSLIELAKEYHNEICTDKDCIIYEKSLPRIKIIFGPSLGINLITLSEENFTDEFYYLVNSDFNVAVCPSLGFYTMVSMPYVSERLFFQYEGMISKHNFRTVNTYYDPLSETDFINDISMMNYVWNNSFNFRYEFPTGKLRPVFEAGFFLNYYFKSDYKRDLSFTMDGSDYQKEFNDYPFRKFDRGVGVGTGLIGSVKNMPMRLDLRYKRGFGIINGLETNTFSLTISMQIGK
jgi:hypothetical protein